MKAIKIGVWMSVLFMVPLKAQDANQSTSLEAKLRYGIVSQKTAPNNRWTVFRKSYKYNSDTLILVNHQDFKAVQQFPKAAEYHFTAHSNLLLLNKGYAELINPNSGTMKVWSNLNRSQWMKTRDLLIVLHKNAMSGNDLEVWNEAHLVKICKDVEQFFVVNDELFFTRKSDHDETILYSESQPDRALCKTNGRFLTAVWSDGKESCWMIETSDGKRDMIYVDGEKVYHLKDDLHIDFQSARLEKIGLSSGFFVKLSYTQADVGSVNPDIWYSGDRNLEKKFHGGSAEISLIWNPSAHHAKVVGEESFKEVVNIGNHQYLISFDPTAHQNYISNYTQYEFSRFNIETREVQPLGKAGYLLVTGGTGRYFLSNPDGQWHFYDLDTSSIVDMGISASKNAYFSDDDRYILFEGDGKLRQYSITDKLWNSVPLWEHFRPEILNSSQSVIESNYLIARKQTYNREKALIIKLYDDVEDLSAIISYKHQKKPQTIIQTTRKRLESFVFEKDRLLSFITQDYNQPPYVNLVSGNRSQIIYKTNKDDTTVSKMKSERISFTNSEGVKLTGILYYPLNYNKELKYPMIVGIYQRQSKLGNKYLADRFYDKVEGFNIRSYLVASYFVFFPDIVFDKRGTGFSALDCVHSALDALKGHRTIDFKKIGLIGHSHGGYETNFIATHSDRFAAYASGAGNSDLVKSYFSFNYNFLKPFYYQFENGQYEMPGSFEDYKELYISNSPIYSVSNVNAPILLWAGKKDQNIDWSQVMEFYIGLKRNHKNAVALFYADEGHGLLNPSNQSDISTRIREWFGYYLKGDQNAQWIINQ
ncbi:alpha/beta hydrolase family protein [Epilithonimonas sp.]|uniref:alpha/beta hydrolase family protein n=1 Tax=Epilithonimonas sp. TaxID=2894511 RepID=UPI0028AA44D3|nr:prolyl oligopeptidase family serine peptidase [Epilithonimonas sp.]